ncbi:response regulator transcription factor [Rhizobium sp. RU36D]|uniref:response regulator transcription factor n=1 Tax=Rhizobium sp. RU36D TaxID=1907415 RepID=UPI0009D81DB9|nr:response regulator transcription factor [Rhizobium sp. RU36D]SMD00261.1 two component transcriptional regulator, winged helix family [Rhizobium sp. RU36D]
MIQDPHPENIRVLLVEDNSFLRNSLSDYLRLRDMKVTEATSGAEFYSCFDPMSLDVAVIDVNLPDTSGFQLTASIRERSDIGVIILTARTKREDRIRGYGEGADIYLTKPVDTEELALAIVNLSRRRRNQVGPMTSSSIVKTAATWKLDRAKHVLNTPGGVAVKLSTRETAFLEYLAARSNVVVSRIELAAIFGEDRQTSGSRVTDVALARLRARIRQSGTELPLQVIRNSGYKLVTTVVVN